MDRVSSRAAAHLKRLEANPLVQTYIGHWSAFSLLLELCLSLLFIWNGPLHPIDYPTYLQQARSLTRNHDWDYSHYHGSTGPLVYPAFHLYIFSIFERLLGNPKLDENASPWWQAQLIFLGLNLAVTRIVHHIYAKISPTPHWDCLFFLFTVRARNIFVNGLFNDGFEVLFVYAGLLAFLGNRPASNVILLFSIAASIKMNALLWAPGLVVHYICTLGPRRTFDSSKAGLLWQFVISCPFLVAHPFSYVSRSFQLTRNFKWFNSVYWKWIPTSVFYSPSFHIFLQLGHLTLLVILTRAYRQSTALLPGSKQTSHQQVLRLSVTFFITTHFSGIMFAKSLHYSFYLWYFHLLPQLYRAADIPWLLRPMLALWIELCWNQWHSYKRNEDGSLDRLDSCGSWKGGLGLFVAHAVLACILVQKALLSRKERLLMSTR